MSTGKTIRVNKDGTLYFLGNITKPFPKNSENSEKFWELAIDGFYHKRGHFGILDNGKITVHINWHGRRHHHNFATSDGFQHMRGQSGVVFQAQSNGEVTVQISWHGRRPHHNFATSGWILTYEGSIQGSFSCPIQWWGHCKNQLTWKKTSP